MTGASANGRDGPRRWVPTRMQGSPPSWRRILLGLAVFLGAAQAAAGEDGAVRSYNDRGGAGLVRTPTARFADDGRLALGYAHTREAAGMHLSFQAFPWLETSLLYGRGSGSTPSEPGVDFKLRLLEEKRALPALAFGIRDFGRPERQPGEYLVASKRLRDFDLSFGVGRGRLAARDDVKGLALFGGVDYFTGIDGLRLKIELDGATPEDRSRLNAGVEYNPLPGIGIAVSYLEGRVFELRSTVSIDLNKPPERAKLEPDLRLLSRGAAARRVLSDSPDESEVGPVARAYRFHDLVEAGGLAVTSIAHSRGRLVVEVATQGAPSSQPRIRETVRDAARVLNLPVDSVVVSWTRAAQAEPPLRAAAAAGYAPRISRILRRDLAAQGLALIDLRLTGPRIAVTVENLRFGRTAVAVGRAARIIANALPPGVEIITIALSRRGVEAARVSLLRKDLENALEDRGSPQEIWQNIVANRAFDRAEMRDEEKPGGRAAKFTWSIEPALHMAPSSSEGSRGVRALVRARSTFRPMPYLEIGGAVRADAADGFEDAAAPEANGLPSVRRDFGRYANGGGLGLDSLQAAYIRSMAAGVDARLKAGYLEEMFVGLGGEVLYRPGPSDWALGGEVYGVRKRGFDRFLSLGDYQAITGHLTLYYRLPHSNYRANLSIGRYLAGDWGGTVELSRRFSTGIRVAGFLTLTDVDSVGSFAGEPDAGLSVTVPLDLFTPHHTRNRALYAFRRLTRDAGQRLETGPRLIDLVASDGFEEIDRGWENVLK